MQEKYGLLLLNFWISTQFCCNRTGDAWITTTEFQKHTIIQCRVNPVTGIFVQQLLISNQNQEQPLQPGSKYDMLHALSTVVRRRVKCSQQIWA